MLWGMEGLGKCSPVIMHCMDEVGQDFFGVRFSRFVVTVKIFS